MSNLDLFALSVAEIFGDFKFKDFARHGGSSNFLQGTLGYVGVVYFLIRSLRTGNVMYVNGMWDGVSAVMETLAAYLILGERLKTPWQYGGLVLIIGGLFMLHSGGVVY